MPRRTFHALTLLIALALSAIPASRGVAAAAAPKPGTFYLALGDSISLGFQPEPSVSWAHGWVYQFRDRLHTLGPVEVADIANGGECTDTMIKGGMAADCVTKPFTSPSQLDEAVAYLIGHADRVNPVTVDIGANNLNGIARELLLDTPAQRRARLATVYAQVRRDWRTIFGRLRATCPRCTIIALNQYNPFPPGALPFDPRPIFVTYNRLLAGTATAYRVRVADIYTPFVGHELVYTWVGRGDNHPTTKGYAAIARAVARTYGLAAAR